MVFVRGQSQDYDTWAQLGNRGWSYREVLPIFQDMESYQGDADNEYRGRGGPLKVTESNESGAIYDALITRRQAKSASPTPRTITARSKTASA
jgi:choline dehydrogenase